MTTSLSLPLLGTVQSRADMLAALGSKTRRASALRPAGGGPIVGLAITRQRNPDAPDVVVIQDTPRARSEAEQMVAAARPLPVWLRRRPGEGWTFVGRWRPVAVDTGPDGLTAAWSADLDPFDDAHSLPVGVLRLEPEGEVVADSSA